MQHKASLAQGKQVLDLFSERTRAEVQQFVENGDLLTMMSKANLRQVDRQAFAALLAPTLTDLFRTPQQIFEAFVEFNSSLEWGFTDEQLQELKTAMPTEFVSRLVRALSLKIWLGDLPTTIEGLWAANQAVHNRNWRYEKLKSGKKQLKLLDANRFGNQLSVTWTAIDLTANRNQHPTDVRTPQTSPGPAVLATAALHPDWPKAIDYDIVPAVWMPGLLATLPGEHAWQHVPVLDWSQFRNELYFNASWDDDRSPRYAVPEFREL